MTSIIIDDNEQAIKTLDGLLKHFCPQVKVIGKAQSIKDAVLLINELNPDIVFLDVEMNNETGFDLFPFFPNLNFIVIFTTSHEKYAIKAFKTECFDYLLKPIDPVELANCIGRIVKEKNDILNSQRDHLLSNSIKHSTFSKKIAFISDKGYSFIEEDDVVYFNADGKYTNIFTNKGETFTSSKNIGEIEGTLSDNFFRCHKSWIINLKYITKYLKDKNQALLLNDIVVEISSLKKNEFLKLFNKI
ncbi:MAG: response regulator transcription factor [Bacteroidia bacterium]|nr:response regulator transcription factor [Bacteroidia bacterium]